MINFDAEIKENENNAAKKSAKYGVPSMDKIIESYHENIQETSDFIAKKCKRGGTFGRVMDKSF